MQEEDAEDIFARYERKAKNDVKSTSIIILKALDILKKEVDD